MPTVKSRTTRGITALAARVAAGAARHGLWQKGDHVLVAVSGGPDSTALLAVLLELAPGWHLTVSAGHINYGLRGEESDADAAFVTDLCRRWDVPLTVMPVALGDWRSRGRSVQQAARDARYSLLLRLARQAGATTIALGHTADDQAETVLLWLLRGAGLAGMPRRRPPCIIRPLLDVTRDDILVYLRARKLSYRTDSSNESRRYTRNRIRHDVVPALRAINPAILSVLTRQADLLRDDAACLDALAADRMGRLTRHRADGTMMLDAAGFARLPVALQRRIMRLLLRTVGDAKEPPPFQTTMRLVQLALKGRTGAMVETPHLRATREYDDMVLMLRADVERAASAIQMALTIPGQIDWPPTGQRIAARVAAPPDLSMPAADVSRVLVDAARVTSPLTVRTWRPGDRLQPAGMRGRKKIQDVFADMKVPRSLRHRVPIVLTGDKVIWIAGYRAAAPFLATPGTVKAVRLDLTDGERGSRS